MDLLLQQSLEVCDCSVTLLFRATIAEITVLFLALTNDFDLSSADTRLLSLFPFAVVLDFCFLFCLEFGQRLSTTTQSASKLQLKTAQLQRSRKEKKHG